jgi:uncharacterized membrane protein YphA (DoxX/SURF4 family)
MWASSKLPAAQPGHVLVILRITLGAMFGSTFFSNLEKGLYSAHGYAGLIRSYIHYGHAPAVWKAVMGSMAAAAVFTAPLQAALEASLAVLLIIGLFSRPAALMAFVFLSSLWVSEWGIGWIWELLMPMIVAASLVLGPSGQHMAVDVAVAERWPRIAFW